MKAQQFQNWDLQKLKVLKNWTLQKLNFLKLKPSKIEILKNWSLHKLKSSKDEAFKIKSFQKLKVSQFKFCTFKVFKNWSFWQFMSSMKGFITDLFNRLEILKNQPVIITNLRIKKEHCTPFFYLWNNWSLKIILSLQKMWRPQTHFETSKPRQTTFPLRVNLKLG